MNFSHIFISSSIASMARIYHGRGEMLDQIFVSEELLPLPGVGKRKLPVVDSIVDFALMPNVSDNFNVRANAVAPGSCARESDFRYLVYSAETYGRPGATYYTALFGDDGGSLTGGDYGQRDGTRRNS